MKQSDYNITHVLISGSDLNNYVFQFQRRYIFQNTKMAIICAFLFANINGDVNNLLTCSVTLSSKDYVQFQSPPCLGE